jgi:hypothetical protein
MTPTLCSRHEAVVAACIRNAGHLDETTQHRLRTDYGRICRPGRFWRPPLTVTESIRENR